ncbi:hypothetical protein KAH37_00735, partial [bacterium]|nr:hypothetical protein [bacterium]
VLSYAGGVENYRYILAGMLNEPPEKEAIYGKHSLLGKDAFKEKLFRQGGWKPSEIDFVAQPEYSVLIRRDPEQVRRIVMKVCRVSKKNLIVKKRNNIARKIYGLMLKRETLLKIREIAEILDMSYHGVGSLLIRFEEEVNQSKKLSELVDTIKEKLYI